MARRPKDTPLPSTIVIGYSLHWRLRRRIHRNAKATASHGWLPSAAQPEPHWVTEWDGENRSAIATLIANFEMDTLAVLQTIANFNDAVEIQRPIRVQRTPESRREHQQWEAYDQIRQQANRGVVMYEQRRETLLRNIQAKVDLSQSGRGVFYQKLSEYHPRPSEVKGLNVKPLLMESDFGGGPMVALQRARQTIESATEKLRHEGELRPLESLGAPSSRVMGEVGAKQLPNGHKNVEVIIVAPRADVSSLSDRPLD